MTVLIVWSSRIVFALLAFAAVNSNAQFSGSIVTVPLEIEAAREALISIRNTGEKPISVDSVKWTIQLSKAEPGFYDQAWLGVDFSAVKLEPGQSLCVRTMLSPNESKIIEVKVNRLFSAKLDHLDAVSVIEQDGDKSRKLNSVSDTKRQEVAPTSPTQSPAKVKPPGG